MNFYLFLVISGATTVAAVIPVAPLINDKVDRVLEDGVLCDIISNDGCVEPISDFYMWNQSWWFWPEFFDGGLSGLGKGLRRSGDCAFELGNASFATCEIGFSDLWLRYQWRVKVKDRKLPQADQQDNPRAVVELGSMMATVAGGTMRMTLQREPTGEARSTCTALKDTCDDGNFRVESITTGQTEIKEVVFGNSTLRWRRKELDTKEPDFQWRLRDMLAFWVTDYFETMTFKDIFNKALTTLKP
ncbi:uncharacterized protein [Dermacentor albipictus]|uniref:uncharacterized protein isoform X1 n=1 Tax=Dermacentor albipictus TaxID=60249 RepID=UPI0031FBB9DB